MQLQQVLGYFSTLLEFTPTMGPPLVSFRFPKAGGLDDQPADKIEILQRLVEAWTRFYSKPKRKPRSI